MTCQMATQIQNWSDMFVRSSLMNACIYYGPQILEVQEKLQPCYDNTLYTLTTVNCKYNL